MGKDREQTEVERSDTEAENSNETESSSDSSEEEITKPVEKKKRNYVMTEKRRIQFEQARQKRLQNIEKRKKEKLKQLLLDEVGSKVKKELQEEAEQPKVKPKKPKKKVVVASNHDSHRDSKGFKCDECNSSHLNQSDSDEDPTLTETKPKKTVDENQGFSQRISSKKKSPSRNSYLVFV